jgi:aspartate-semialdehyde dehydrogenase
MVSSPKHDGRRDEHSFDFASRLSDGDLLRAQAYVGGRWTKGEGGPPMSVFDPATGRQLGEVASLSSGQVQRAIQDAESAFVRWRDMLPQDRSRLLRCWAELMDRHSADLALMISYEQGKPLDEARGEITYARGFLEWFAEEAKRIRGESFTSHLAGRQTFVSREPVGVTAAITPWNFPSAMIARKAGAALAAGCTMLVKPAPETPFSALALAVLSERAGIPAGVFSVITGDPGMIGSVLCESSNIRSLSFTGSTQVGRILFGQSAPTIKKLSLELGGHAPFVVFADADLDRAVDGAIAAKFQTSGQDCLAANRILVEEPVYGAFLESFEARVRRLQVGAGTEDGVEIGPLIHAKAVDRCVAQVRDAVAKGAKLLVGGQPHHRGPAFMQPTLLADVHEGMTIWREETFGPVAAVSTFQSEADAIRQANDSEYGLAAYVYTENSGRALRVSDAVRYGMVAINTPQFTGPPIPFGGMKQSGLGREGSSYGIEDYTELKYRCVAA